MKKEFSITNLPSNSHSYIRIFIFVKNSRVYLRNKFYEEKNIN